MKLVPLWNRKGQIVAYTKVDDIDYRKVMRWRWTLTSTGKYALGVVNGRQVLLHRFLTEAPPGVLVDHKDGNGLNNTRANLRVADHIKNGANSQLSRRNKTGYKGVYYDKIRNKYQAAVGYNRKRLVIGRFNSAEEAARAYDRKAIELFGEFARTNLPKEEYHWKEVA